MRKKTLSSSITLLFCSIVSLGVMFPISGHATYDNDFIQQKITNGINLAISLEGKDYGKLVVPVTYDRYDTIWFKGYERTDLESEFRGIISQKYKNAYEFPRYITGSTTTGNTVVLVLYTGENLFFYDIQNIDAVRNQKAMSGSISSYERAKNMFFDKLYTSLIASRNKTTVTPPLITNTGLIIINPANPKPPVSINPYKEYKLIENYETTAGKVYAIRQAPSGRYRFQKGGKTGFDDIEVLKNFLDRANRIIYMAPNKRMYGIFKNDGVYYFNRDEGSISTLSRSSSEDTKIYIDQHNQPTATCRVAREWKCR